MDRQWTRSNNRCRPPEVQASMSSDRGNPSLMRTENSFFLLFFSSSFLKKCCYSDSTNKTSVATIYKHLDVQHEKFLLQIELGQVLVQVCPLHHHFLFNKSEDIFWIVFWHKRGKREEAGAVLPVVIQVKVWKILSVAENMLVKQHQS